MNKICFLSNIIHVHNFKITSIKDVMTQYHDVEPFEYEHFLISQFQDTYDQL